MIRYILPLLIATTAQAEFALRDGDTTFDVDALDTRLRGQVLTFFDDGQSRYFDDGRYTYTYANDGGTAYGTWRIEADGQVCVDFINGFARCDLYVMQGDRMILLDADGDRYPVRP